MQMLFGGIPSWSGQLSSNALSAWSLKMLGLAYWIRGKMLKNALSSEHKNIWTDLDIPEQEPIA